MNLGEWLEFAITLVGNRCHYSEEVLYALKVMLYGQIAGVRGAFELCTIYNAFNREYVYVNGAYNIKSLGMLEWSDQYTDIDAGRIKVIFHTLVDIRVENKLKKTLPFDCLIFRNDII